MHWVEEREKMAYVLSKLIKVEVCVYVMEYYLSLKRKEILQFATT